MEGLIQNRKGGHFASAMAASALFMFVFFVAFVTEDRGITGFAVNEQDSGSVVVQNLMEFDDASSLGSLGAGNYYITADGVVYWTDQGMIPVARIKNLHESQKNRKIYIDSFGNLGYLI